MTGDIGCPNVELYVRSLTTETTPRRERVAGELTALSERGAVEDYTVQVWGKEVPSEGTHPLTAQVAAFREWAEEMGVELVGVEERSRGTLVDESQPVVTLPTMALAEYRDGDLACVAPYRCGDRVVRIRDRLDALEPDEPNAVTAAPASH